MARVNRWRGSIPTVRFLWVDARAGFSVLPAFLLMRWVGYWAWVGAGVLFIVFAVLERFKFSLPVLRRYVRALLAGPIRYGVAWWHKPQKRY